MLVFLKRRIVLGMFCLLLFSSLAIAFAEDVDQFVSFEKYDWSKVLAVPPGTKYTDGNQILHFKSKNKHYSESSEASLFVNKYLLKARPAGSDAEVLRIALDEVLIQGAYVEMGVCTGKTINFIAALNPYQTIHGFDSFKGLPEDWMRGDVIVEKGTFGFKNPNQLPAVLHNVILHPGWFRDTLSKFKKEVLKDFPIAFLHIDSDIYSSAKEVFQALGDNIREGTIIVFDEFYNYPGYENHEWKAFNEFLNDKKFAVEYIVYNVNHEQVALRIHGNKK